MGNLAAGKMSVGNKTFPMNLSRRNDHFSTNTER